jgi:hypothetical protein
MPKKHNQIQKELNIKSYTTAIKNCIELDPNNAELKGETC